MSEAEVREWRSALWSDEMCRLRKWDDQAKEIGLEVPGVDAYEGLIERHLEAERDGKS